jgi:hypothetical protein
MDVATSNPKIQPRSGLEITWSGVLFGSRHIFLTANHLVEQSWSLICAFSVEVLVPLHPDTEMTLQTASFVFDCPQNIRDPPGHVLKMSAKQYYTPQSVTSSQGLVLLFSHCIGARRWIFAHLTLN